MSEFDTNYLLKILPKLIKENEKPAIPKIFVIKIRQPKEVCLILVITTIMMINYNSREKAILKIIILNVYCNSLLLNKKITFS